MPYKNTLALLSLVCCIAASTIAMEKQQNHSHEEALEQAITERRSPETIKRLAQEYSLNRPGTPRPERNAHELVIATPAESTTREFGEALLNARKLSAQKQSTYVQESLDNLGDPKQTAVLTKSNDVALLDVIENGINRRAQLMKLAQVCVAEELEINKDNPAFFGQTAEQEEEYSTDLLALIETCIDNDIARRKESAGLNKTNK